MFGKYRWVAFAALASALPTWAADDFELVDDSSARVTIEAPIGGEITADLTFFTNAVYRSTGALIPIKPKAEGPRIVFRVEQRLVMEEDDWSLSFPASEVMEIRGTRHSCRWALNWLLEDRLGVVFCMNGINGTHYPQRKGMSVARQTKSGTASLKIERTLYAEDPFWMRSLGGKEQLPGRQFYNHNIGNILPKDKYGEDPWREQLMPLLKGKREKPKYNDMFWQPCFSSPACVPECVKNIRAYLDAHPEEHVYSLTMNDNGGYCQCDGCKAMNGGSLKSFSTIYFTWANAVAREIAKSHPYVTLGLLGYGATVDPPPFALEKNLLVFLCGSIYQNGDQAVGLKRLKMMEKWSEKVTSFGVWDYPYGPTVYVAPRVYSKRIADFFRQKDSKYPTLNAYFGEGAAMFSGEGPKRYLYLKYMFNSKLDLERTLDTWYRACVGDEAAPFLRKYYELWEDFWCGERVKETDWYKTINNGYMALKDISYLKAVDQPLVDRAAALAERAHDAAMRSGDAGQRARAERLYTFHRFYTERMGVSGIGEKALDRPIKTAADAIAFMKEFSAVVSHAAEVSKLVKRVLELDEPEKIHRYAYAYDSFRRSALLNEMMESRLCDAAGFASDPGVAEAMRAAAKDAKMNDLYRGLIGVLMGKKGLKPLIAADAVNPTGAEEEWIRDSKYGAKLTRKDPNDPKCHTLVATSNGEWPALARIVEGLSFDRSYFRFAARVKNTSSAKLSVRFCRDTLDMVPVSNIFEIAPGETRTMAVIGQKAYKAVPNRFFLILNGLPKGESAEILGIALEDTELTPVAR